MIIIGCDYHPSFQQIAFVDTETGELQERRLQHREEAEKFYRDLAAQGMKVRVGMEASGHARWFERLLAELQFELWIGDAAEISTKRVRKQKTDRQDFMSMKDSKGKELFQKDFCDAARKPSGVWSEYWWPKPGEKEGSRKLTYSLGVKGTPYVVSAGVYDDNATIAELSKLSSMK